MKTIERGGSWHGIVPGDLVVSPGAIAWRIRDMDRWRENNCRVLILQRSPFIVISRQHEFPNFPLSADMDLFFLLTRHGILFTINYVVDKREQDAVDPPQL